MIFQTNIILCKRSIYVYNKNTSLFIRRLKDVLINSFSILNTVLVFNINETEVKLLSNEWDNRVKCDNK